MKIEYITHMGDDLMVVDAARVSFDKKSEWEYGNLDQFVFGDGQFVFGDNASFRKAKEKSKHLKDSDAKLIKYLAKHHHWTPFAHPQLQVRVTVPIFIANQLKRHVVGLALNEVSRRYVDDEPTFYEPKEWRKRPDASIKQGSSDETIEEEPDAIEGLEYRDIVNVCQAWYARNVRNGICPEMARMVLPQSMYTSWIWTGSLAAFMRVYKQRIDGHAQKEVQEIAVQLGGILKAHWPVSFEALKESKT